MTEDVYSSPSEVARTIGCHCGKEAQQHWGHYKDGIGNNWAMSAYERKRVDPQTGVNYENYAHKQRVLKEQGLVEADRLKSPDEIEAEVFDRAAAEAETRAMVGSSSGMLRADNMDEIQKAIDRQSGGGGITDTQRTMLKQEDSEAEQGAWGGL